ncbi:MAG: hypothetical protein HZB46_09945 [Solirubrobacterales bacterium]|nr:hypothetical protein [Solirubrobacterales bacterium]
MSDTQVDGQADPGADAGGAQTTTKLTVGPVAAPAAPRQRDASRRSRSAQWLEQHAATTAAVVLAAPALVLPFGWLVVCLLLALALGTLRRAVEHEGARGPADVVVAPMRTVGSALHPGSLLRAVLAVAGAAIAAIVVSAALGALAWLPSEGTTGAPAAMRMAAIEHGPGLMSALLCFLLLRGGLGHGRSDGVAAARARALTEEGLTACVVAGAVVVLGCVALSSGSWWPAGSTAGAVGLLPGALEHEVEQAQASLVEEEAKAVADCVRDDGGPTGWRVGSAKQLSDGSYQISVRTSTQTFRRDVAVLGLALHNQLAPWASTVRIVTPDMTVAIDRTRLPAGSPLRSLDELGAAAELPKGAFGAERDAPKRALRCSAVAV